MSESITTNVFNSFQNRPSIGILMSGTGSNAQALLESQPFRDLYDVKAIATDNRSSNAQKIASIHKIPYIELNKPHFDTSEQREAYFRELADELDEYQINSVIYAGFMKISTRQFTEQFPGVNVHPADLTIVGDDGLPKYRGMRAMEDMAKDMGYVKSTVHIVDTPVDSGTAIATTAPLKVAPDEPWEAVHARLKNLEHHIFPTTLVKIAQRALKESDLPISVLNDQENTL